MDTKRKQPDTNNEFSNEFYQTIFMQAGDGIFLIDEQGVIIEANPRGCEILGYARDELRGLPVMQLHPADEIDHIQKKLAQLAKDKLITIESVFLRKDGSRVPVEITGKLLSNNQIIGLLRDISERKKTERATQELLSTDPITGLYNRRYFFGIVTALIAEAARYERPITFMILDLDHFKKVNDTYGHAKGDLALLHLANSIRHVTRASDIAARFGGDEFVIFLPQTDTVQAVYLAKRLREHLSGSPVPNIGEKILITLSIGMTSVSAPYQSLSIDLLIEQADLALYQAKQQGRDRICVWTMPGSDSSRENLSTIK